MYLRGMMVRQYNTMIIIIVISAKIKYVLYNL